MPQQIQFQVTPEQAKDNDFLQKKIANELQLSDSDFTFQWKKRSVDARKAQIKVNCTLTV